MNPVNKEKYIQIAQDELERVKAVMGENIATHYANGSDSVKDQVPLDCHAAIQANPGKIRQLHDTINFLRGCLNVDRIDSGAEFNYTAKIDGNEDQKGSYLFFVPTPEIPNISHINGLPNIITGKSRVGQRFLGQTSGTIISVPSEENGITHIWEVVICNVE